LATLSRGFAAEAAPVLSAEDMATYRAKLRHLRAGFRRLMRELDDDLTGEALMGELES
jgi:hypothetical protein